MQKSIKTFFHKYDKIRIRKIIHDSADIDNHEYFPWHSIFKLNKDDHKLDFHTDKIQFLDSDHRKSGDRNSHFIQLTDLLMGLFYNSFHNSSKGKKAQELTGHVFPICEQLSKEELVSYDLFGKIDLDFFPKDRISTADTLENTSKRFQSFYKKRILYYQENNGQIELF